MSNLKIKKIQNLLKEKNINTLIINRTDEFLNEYISSDSERLRWATDFSGSAGRAIICQNSASLYVDGRYTFQAKEQVDTSQISLEHLNDFSKNLSEYFIKNECVALDPKLHSIEETLKYLDLMSKSETRLYFMEDNLIDELWDNKPNRNYGFVFDHPKNFAGTESSKKLENVINTLEKSNLDAYFLSSLDSIAWLLNLRGSDILNTPLAFAYLLISQKDKPALYLKVDMVQPILKERLAKYINIEPIENIKQVFNHLKPQSKIGFDYKNSSYFFYDLAIKKNCLPSHLENPCLFPKATKNAVELEGARTAHVRDGVSVTKFLYWLKNHPNIENETEVSAADKLFSFRNLNDLFHSISFDTISAIGKNAALPHYRYDKNNPISLKENTIYLFDSGGQYYDGTTDITRTVILGEATKKQKEMFTRVLKGHISLSKHTFPKQTKGTDIDYLARASLQEIGCDYDHGTGHGIGSFLSVHEAPQRISKKNMFPSVDLLPGMILSNEPGFYKEGEYGIRIENILIVKEENENLLNFENISWAPIDKDLIEPSLLNSNDVEWLNSYHETVFDKLSIFLTAEEKLWLQNVTSPL